MQPERPTRHLTYGNVVSTLALLAALGGTAWAASEITGRDVVDGSITGRDIRANSLELSHVVGHAHTPSAGVARRLAGTTVYEGRSTPPPAGEPYLAARYGKVASGAGRQRSVATCHNENEILLDGEVNSRGLAGPPKIDLTEVATRVSGRAAAGGYVQAIAKCLGVSVG